MFFVLSKENANSLRLEIATLKFNEKNIDL